MCRCKFANVRGVARKGLILLQRLQTLTDNRKYLDLYTYEYAYICNYPQLYVGCEVLPGFAHPCCLAVSKHD